MSCVLTFDLGGSSLRAALIDRNGAVIARHVVVAPVIVDRLGWSEADADGWWRMLADAAEALAAEAPDAFGSVAAIAVSAFTRSQVFVDRNGRALRPAILWRDTRAEKLLPALKAACPGDHPELANISVFHPLARLWWLKHEEEATFRATTRMLEPKDYLHVRLTGAVAGDHVSYARLAAAAAPAETGPSLFAATGLPASVIPALQPPVSIVARVQPGLPGALARLEGAAVVAMANDTWASVVGLGAMAPGLAYNLSGTTEVLGLVSDVAAVSTGLLTVDWSAGVHQLGGPSQSGGDCVMWLIELIGGQRVAPKDAGAILDRWLSGAREPEPVVFLPYLQGERVPYWDPHLRGAFVGLNRRHGPTDLAWAVIEGIAFLNRVVLEQAEAATGVTASEIRFGGGGAANAHWRQVKADVMNRPVGVVEGGNEGLLGAAIAAWTALGVYPDLQAAQAALVTIDRRIEPRPERRAGYDALFRLFRRSEAALAPISRDLVAWHRTYPPYGVPQ